MCTEWMFPCPPVGHRLVLATGHTSDELRESAAQALLVEPQFCSCSLGLPRLVRDEFGPSCPLCPECWSTVFQGHHLVACELGLCDRMANVLMVRRVSTDDAGTALWSTFPVCLRCRSVSLHLN